MAAHEDRWLLPRQQTEYPTRDLIAEPTLHARREATFLALATMVVVATTATILLGASPLVDVTALVASLVPDFDLPVVLALPVGMLATALAFVAVMLACELYGRRRASALVWASMFAAASAIGLARLIDLVDGHAATLGAALAFAGYFVAGQLANLLVFDALRARTPGRRLWLRALLAALASQLVGGAALAAALYGDAALAGSPDTTRIAAIAAGSAGYVIACVIVLLIPLAVAAHVLALYLRVARFASDDMAYDDGPQERQLPAAMIVEEHDDAASSRPRRRAMRASLQPFSSAEQRFFTEGDQLAEPSTD